MSCPDRRINRRRRLAWRALLFASSAATATSSLAQQIPAGAQVGEVSEIVVTATKRSESVQKVPISIQALSAERMEQHQVSGVDDYVKLLPSVSFQSYGPGQSQLYFRGVTSGGDGGYGVRGGSLPTSGLYIDEIPVTTIGNAVDFHVYDIARVEALSGPQGTLFGASSLAGTLRLITNQPDLEKFAAGYDLEGNRYGKGQAGGVAEGFVNIPVSERAALRLVGFYDRDGGYIDNIQASRTYSLGDNDPTNDITINNRALAKKNFNDVRTYGGRASLRLDLNDNWTATPSLIYQNQVAHGAFLSDPAQGDLRVNDFVPDINEDHWYQAALTVQGKISDWDMVYAGGYMDRSIRNEADYSYYTVAYDTIPGFTMFPDGQGGYLDPTQAFSGDDQLTKQTHEVRLSSPSDKRLRFLGGLFAQRQTDTARSYFTVAGLAAIPGSPAVANCGDAIFCTNVEIINRDYAAFTEVAYQIREDLTLTAGIRGFKYKNTSYGYSGFQSSSLSSGCVDSARTDVPCVNIDTRVSGTGETHKLNLSWQIDPEHMIYGTWSTGFRPGGANRVGSIRPYTPDKLTNFELGWKTTWFGRRLTVNGAAFIENWNKLQYGLPGAGGVISIYNAGDARIKGVEGDVVWRPWRGLMLSSSGAYVDAKLTTDFCGFDAGYNTDCSQGVAAAKGTRLPVQPRLKINATARYGFDWAGLDAFVQGAVQHQSGTRSWLTDNEAQLLGPTRGFTTVDWSAGLGSDNRTAELFVQNVFDKRGELSINTVCVPSICGGAPRVYNVKPQLIGLKFGQRF